MQSGIARLISLGYVNRSVTCTEQTHRVGGKVAKGRSRAPGARNGFLALFCNLLPKFRIKKKKKTLVRIHGKCETFFLAVTSRKVFTSKSLIWFRYKCIHCHSLTTNVP